MKKILTVIFILAFTCVYSKDFDFNSYFKQKVKELYPEAVKVRRHLHKYPELCLKEEKTALYVKEYLKKCGLDVQTGIAGTGIKAVLKGNREKPVIGIRADMDALPITEETGLDFRSQHKGVMHACGHDGHMTNVLLTAKILSQIKDKIPGTVVFIFQPCEEGSPDGSPSGASQMITEGVLDNPKIDAMLGLHVMPGYRAGAVALREGPIMANVASVFITIKGKASHGAFPHQGTDAIYAASLAVLQFQSIISRLKDPKENAVLTIGKINGGVRFNVIADRVDMEGTVRSFSVGTEDKIEQGMDNVLKGLVQSLGITYEFKFSRGSKFVKNDAKLTQLLTPLFKKLLGEDNVFITDPLTIAEDFSAYSHKIPSFFFFLGAGENMTLHHPKFSVDEKIFLYGPLLFSSAAIECLNYFNKN
jgi:amidohydrolase